MIKDKIPVAMYEVETILESVKESEKTNDVKAYLKKFSKLDEKKAKKLKAELEEFNFAKLKQSDIIKIIDLLPENAVELNKIFTEVSLDSDEISKILDAIKNNK